MEGRVYFRKQAIDQAVKRLQETGITSKIDELRSFGNLPEGAIDEQLKEVNAVRLHYLNQLATAEQHNTPDNRQQARALKETLRLLAKHWPINNTCSFTLEEPKDKPGESYRVFSLDGFQYDGDSMEKYLKAESRRELEGGVVIGREPVNPLTGLKFLDSDIEHFHRKAQEFKGEVQTSRNANEARRREQETIALQLSLARERAERESPPRERAATEERSAATQRQISNAETPRNRPVRTPSQNPAANTLYVKAGVTLKDIQTAFWSFALARVQEKSKKRGALQTKPTPLSMSILSKTSRRSQEQPTQIILHRENRYPFPLQTLNPLLLKMTKKHYSSHQAIK